MMNMTSQTNQIPKLKLVLGLAVLVLLLIAAAPGDFHLDGGSFPTPTPTPTTESAGAVEPAPTETPTLVPVETIIEEPTATPVFQPALDQPQLEGDNIAANAEAVEDQGQGGVNLLLLGIPFLAVIFVVVVIVGFYWRRSRELG